MARSMVTNRSTVTDRSRNLTEIGKALNFVAGQVTVNDNAAFNAGQAFTMEAWVFESGNSNNGGEIIKKDNQFLLRIDNDGSRKIQVVFWTSGGAVNFLDVATIPTNQWIHLAVTYDGATVKLWRGGVMVASSPLTGNISDSANNFLIGSGSGFEYFRGSIDELRISSSVRYTDTFTPTRQPFASDANTIALYHLDEGSGTAIDNAEGTAALDGTLSGTASWINGYIWGTGSNSRSTITPDLEDHFSGSNIDTSKWNLAGAEATWSIDAGRLKCVKAGNDWANNIIISTKTDFTALHLIGKVYVPTGQQARQIVFRSNKTTGSGYGIQLRVNELRLENWGIGTIGSKSKTHSADTWYWIEVTVIGSHILARSWENGQNQPAYWEIDIIDSNNLHTSGAVGFSMEDSGTDNIGYFNDIVVNGRIPISYVNP